MREKIDLFARGVFTYEKPVLTASESSIYISAEMGKVYTGSFLVSSSGNKRFKGIVYSTDILLSFAENTFSGSEVAIKYSFDATHLDINDVSKGRISLVTDLGEIEIPFQAKVRVPTLETSVGPASDMFHFTNLAQVNWSEAKTLFKSPEFRSSLSFYDPKYDNIYRTIKRSGNASLALEEFLVAVKKNPVEIKPEVAEISVENPIGVCTGAVVLSKNTWGYSQLSIETKGDFLSVEKSIIWTDDFEGNSYTLTYAIDSDRLHAGTNLGLICIHSVRSEIEIPVIVKNNKNDLRTSLARRKCRHLEAKLLNGLMEYRMGHVSAAKLVSDAQKQLDDLKMLRSEDCLVKLYRIWLSIEAGKETQAILALGVIFEEEEWGDDELLFALALYLKATLERDSMAAELTQRLRDMYEQSRDARIFILCIGLDKKARIGNHARYDALKRSTLGYYSPLVLLEACNIINEEPTVLKSFSGFDLLALNYGLVNKILSKNAVMQAAYLAGREKETTPLAVRVLLRACETYHINETLEALCRHLIMGEVYNEVSFKWLSIGIVEQLHLKNLYECCLKAAGEFPQKALPKGMQTYFENGMTLNDTLKATFYANLVRFRGGTDTISYILMQQIKEFAVRKLAEGSIDENLAVLYNNVLDVSLLDEGTVAMLPDIIFKYAVTPGSERIASVLVSHKELDSEASYEVRNGRALVDIFTEDPVILYVDSHGNRILTADDGGHVSVTKLITNTELIRLCLSHCSDDEKVILNSLENARYRGDTDEAVELIKRCVDEDNLEPHFAYECKRELIEFYYDNLEGELMESLLVRMDLSVLSRHDRARMLDLIIMRELYSLAIANMELYGYGGVEIKRLAKLVSRLIETGDKHLGTPLFTDICYTVFRKKRHDTAVLGYLGKYYNGDTDSMHAVWSALVEEGINADDIEERLLSQILFTESEMSYSRDVFRRYYGHGSNRRLVRAYISYYAYRYLILDQLPDEDMFEIMRRESMYEENDLAMLAILKYLSQSKLREEDISFAEINIARMEKKGMMMPFFKEFDERVHIPEAMRDRYYVEYHTDPRKRVRIHYCLLTGSEEGSYVDADMRDVGYGIFISEFVLFYGESLQYYISEEDGDNYSITESSEVSLAPELIGSTDENAYHQLNLIITSKEMHDVKTMQKLLEVYVRNDFLNKNLFEAIY